MSDCSRPPRRTVVLLSTAGAELLGFSHQVILPILAKEVLHSGAAGLGILTAARFLGGVLGGGILTTLGAVRHHGALLLATLVLFGIGQVGLAHVPYFWLAVGCVIYINMIAAATDILHLALLQYSVANEQRGRAMGAWIVGIGTAPLGAQQFLKSVARGTLELACVQALSWCWRRFSWCGLAVASSASAAVTCRCAS